jgi:hypothetical protein
VSGSLLDDVNKLLEELGKWELAKKNYENLEQVKEKVFEVNGCIYKVQCNLARIAPATQTNNNPMNKDDKQPNCFLCSNQRPKEQKRVPFKDYGIQINPFPIFPKHLTIPSNKHEPQLIASNNFARFDDMLDLAQQLDGFAVFYNGPKAGASVPSHFHFQAGNKDLFPIVNGDKEKWKYAIRIESKDKDGEKGMIKLFKAKYNSFSKEPDENEPMMNILTWYEKEKGQWTTCIFRRKKFRPACYDSLKEDKLLITPASVEMSGIFIAKRIEDFEKITKKDIADILNEVAEIQA